MLNVARCASVPVAVHLAHGETLANIMRAIRLGFTSVMVAASQENFAANLAQTMQIVKICCPQHISVVPELGPKHRVRSGDCMLAYADLNCT